MGWRDWREFNELFAVFLTRAFGTMWVCYACMVYGLLPLVSFFRGSQDTFLYWSNWVQLWSLPLIMVGTNILGRAVEARAAADHLKLSQAYELILGLIERQQGVMTELQSQDAVLTEQTDILRAELGYLKAGVQPF